MAILTIYPNGHPGPYWYVPWLFRVGSVRHQQHCCGPDVAGV